MVVEMMELVWVLSIIRYLVSRDPEGDHNVDKHPHILLGFPGPPKLCKIMAF